MTRRRRLQAVASHLRPNVNAGETQQQRTDTAQEPYTGMTIDLNIASLSQNPLLDPRPPPSMRVDTAVLKRATRPAFFGFGDSPLVWTAAEWDAMRARQAQHPLFDMDAVRAQFDRRKWELDGVLVLRGVMTEAAQLRWSSACRDVQAMNDRFIAEHERWRDEVDWQALGSTPPTRALTADEVAAATGQSAALPHGWPRTDEDSEASGVRTLRLYSVLPEYFPPGHCPFLMEALCHPQQLELQAMLLDCEQSDLHFCHSQVLNRKAGNSGVAWHAHPIGRDCGGRNLRGPTADLREYFSQPNSIINLAYPDGFAGTDGQLSVLPGAHLVRDLVMPKAMTDQELRDMGWLDGKRHPVTGAPLETVELDLPPVSDHRAPAAYMAARTWAVSHCQHSGF
jgi:hypothetical protein